MSTPTATDGLVRTLDDVAAIAADAQLIPSTGRDNRWRGRRVALHCWPTLAFQVVVYAREADGTDAWSAIFDYETPADLIAHTIRRAQGGAA